MSEKLSRRQILLVAIASCLFTMGCFWYVSRLSEIPIANGVTDVFTFKLGEMAQVTEWKYVQYGGTEIENGKGVLWYVWFNSAGYSSVTSVFFDFGDEIDVFGTIYRVKNFYSSILTLEEVMG